MAAVATRSEVQARTTAAGRPRATLGAIVRSARGLLEWLRANLVTWEAQWGEDYEIHHRRTWPVDNPGNYPWDVIGDRAMRKIDDFRALVLRGRWRQDEDKDSLLK